MSRSPPLRFLVLLLAGWTAIRAAWLAPGWWALPAGADVRGPSPAAAERRTPAPPLRRRPAPSGTPGGRGVAAAAPVDPRPRARPANALRPAALAGPAWSLAPAPAGGGPVAVAPRPARAGAAPAAAASRWTYSAWSFLREGDSAPLAAGGLLGGSQAGARISYRLNADRGRPLALTARLAAPLRRAVGAEAAAGLDWRPSRRLPLHLLAERRQKLGGGGRSAFGLTVYGGVDDVPVAGLRLDAYAQAGLVGARSRDPFGDGALRLSWPLGERVRIGAGAWAAAQPGAARIDLGPQASLRLPLAGRAVTLRADWRRRIAGDARPGSGPALTLATDF